MLKMFLPRIASQQLENERVKARGIERRRPSPSLKNFVLCMLYKVPSIHWLQHNAQLPFIVFKTEYSELQLNIMLIFIFNNYRARSIQMQCSRKNTPGGE